ncbi:MAG: 3'(2'),5'-bisphosphate nucleotidase CysQ [Pseudomonadota bacterium]
MTEPTPDIKAVTAIARRAGAAILEVYARDFTVYEKTDQSPVTEADFAAHRIIVRALKELTPHVPVLSEESATVPFAERSEWERYWLVDPLDGTKEFVNRNGEFTVNIALIEDHSPLVGVVHVPVSGVTYVGVVGNGAWIYEKNGSERAIRVSPTVAKPLRVVGSRSHPGPDLQAFLDAVGEHEMLSMGSSLKLCLVAEGKADIYPRLGLTSEWDTAAAQAVVEAAGGRVTDTSLRILRYNTKESMRNPYFLAFGDVNEDWSRYLA